MPNAPFGERPKRQHPDLSLQPLPAEVIKQAAEIKGTDVFHAKTEWVIQAPGEWKALLDAPEQESAD